MGIINVLSSLHDVKVCIGRTSAWIHKTCTNLGVHNAHTVLVGCKISAICASGVEEASLMVWISRSIIWTHIRPSPISFSCCSAPYFIWFIHIVQAQAGECAYVGWAAVNPIYLKRWLHFGLAEGVGALANESAPVGCNSWVCGYCWLCGIIMGASRMELLFYSFVLHWVVYSADLFYVLKIVAR